MSSVAPDATIAAAASKAADSINVNSVGIILYRTVVAQQGVPGGLFAQLVTSTAASNGYGDILPQAWAQALSNTMLDRDPGVLTPQANLSPVEIRLLSAELAKGSVGGLTAVDLSLEMDFSKTWPASGEATFYTFKPKESPSATYTHSGAEVPYTSRVETVASYQNRAAPSAMLLAVSMAVLGLAVDTAWLRMRTKGDVSEAHFVTPDRIAAMVGASIGTTWILLTVSVILGQGGVADAFRPWRAAPRFSIY